MKHFNHKIFLLIVLFLSLLLTSCGKSSDSALVDKVERYELKYALSEGFTSSIETVLNQTLVQEFMGFPQTVQQTQGIEYLFEVTDVNPDGDITARVTYKALWTETVTEEKTASYDSRKNNEMIPIEFSANDALVGKSFFIFFNKQGEIRSVNGLKELYDEIAGSFAALGSDMQEVLLLSLNSFISEKAIVESMKHLLYIYPVKTVAQNEAWITIYYLTRTYPMDITSRWTLKSYDSSQAVLDVKSILATPKGAQIIVSDMNVAVVIDGQQAGEVITDPETGWLISAVYLQRLRGQMSAPDMVIPVTVSSEIRYTAK